MTGPASPPLAPQPEGIPRPQPGGVSAPYWEAAGRSRLVYQRCEHCGAVPRRPVARCGDCGRDALVWRESTGHGTLYSWTVVWRPQHPSFQVPYAPAIMAVEEGWWLMTALIGCRPEEIRAGMALETEFHPAGDGFWLPYVRPRPGR